MANYTSQFTGAQIDAGIAKAHTAAQPADLAAKQDRLQSGTNIKTVNGQSVLGAGDLSVAGGPAGDSAYQVAVAAGFVGTESQTARTTTQTSGEMIGYSSGTPARTTDIAQWMAIGTRP